MNNSVAPLSSGALRNFIVAFNLIFIREIIFIGYLK